MATLRVKAPDIACDTCQRNIQYDLGGEPGVRSVAVDVEARMVSIEYDERETSVARLCDALTDAGYPPQRA